MRIINGQFFNTKKTNQTNNYKVITHIFYLFAHVSSCLPKCTSFFKNNHKKKDLK